MTSFKRFGWLFVAAAALAACSVNEAGNIPCTDNNNCPPAYPTCGARSVCVAAAPAAKLEVVSGDKQSAISGSSLGVPLVVRVLDTNDNPVQGFTLAWAASTGGSVSQASTVTGPDGKAQITGSIAKVNGTNTFTVTANGLAGSPAQITATGVSGPAAKLVGVSGADQTSVAGTVLSAALVVEVTDANGNPVAGANVTWTTSAGGGSVALSTTTTGADGTASTAASLGTVVGHNAFVASASSAGTSLTGSPVTFNATGAAGAAAHFLLTGPAATVAGVSQNFTLTAEDANGNVATGYRGTAAVISSDGAASLPSAHVFSSSDAGILVFPVTLKTAGSQTVTATDTVNGALTGTTANIIVSPATASSFVVTTTALSNQTAGGAFSVTVTVKDSLGNVATSYAGTVHFTSTDGQVSAGSGLPANSTLISGTRTFPSVQLKTAGAQTITATDTVSSSINGTSPAINVVPAATVSFGVNPQGSSQTAGVAFNVTVTAKDSFANTTPAYAGTVHFTSTDGQAVLPADTILTSGTATLPATLKTVGSQTITATDTVTSSIHGTSSGVTVTPNSTTTFTVTATSPQTAGTSFSATVTAKDAFGNTTPGYLGTVHVTSSDPLFTPPADSTLISGVKAFTVTLKTTPSQTLTATDTTIPAIAGTSSAITVSPSSATTFAVTTSAGAPQTAGVAFDVTVTAKDTFGNIATGYGGTVHFTSTDGTAVAGNGLPGNSTLVSGTKTFPAGATLKTAGSQTITATDTVTGSITGTSPAIDVGPASAASFTFSAIGAQTAGTPFNFTVTAKDSFGNTATGYPGTVHFTSSDGQATSGNGLPADATLIAGTGNFSATLKTAPSQTITARDTVAATTGTTAAITVNPAAASKLVVTALSTTQTAAIAFNVAVTAQDPFGNTATNNTDIVAISSSDSQAVLPPNAALIAGVKMFSVTLKTAGTQSVTATDTVTPAVNGVLSNITVNAGTATTFTVVASSPQTSGQSFQVAVTAKDAGGNTVTTYPGTVAITSSDLAASLPANSTLTSGTRNFPVTLNTAGSQTVTATQVGAPSVTATSSAITVGPGATNKLVLSGYPSSVVAGFANSITVTAQDVAGNTTPSYLGTVHFASNNAGPSLPADYTFLPGDNGTHTFSNGVTLNTAAAGTATLTVSDAGNSLTVTQTGITVVPAPRFFQSTATLIVGGSRGGQIFIAGGSTTNDNLGTATSNTYFYDPVSRSMLPGPAMTTPRYAHTATATSLGQIVIAGGPFPKNGGTDVFEFELCSTDGAPSCNSVGSAKDANRCNAATALATSTRVIIGGGDNCAGGGAFQSIDVWDSTNPNTTTTLNSAGHQLTIGRNFLTATAIGSGKVLFAGGASTASADLFTNNSTIGNSTVGATGAMSIIRSGHTATLLNAGVTTACPSGKGPCVLIAGGITTGAVKTWEIYDGTGNAFFNSAAGHELNVPGRNQHVAAQFSNGKVLLAAGSDGAVTVASTESFDPTAATLGWSPATPLSLPRVHPAGAYVPVSDSLVVVGGSLSTPAVEHATAP